jgi:hypothetical protein
MFRFDAGTSRPAEYSMLVEPRPVGPTIGVYGGLPIAERVVDLFGRRFAYVGVACRRRDGQFDAESLGPGEFIVEPGLAYRLESGKRASQKTVEADRSNLARRAQSQAEAGDVPAGPGEPKRVLGQIAGALMVYLTCAVAIQLVLHVFRAG